MRTRPGEKLFPGLEYRDNESLEGFTAPLARNPNVRGRCHKEPNFHHFDEAWLCASEKRLGLGERLRKLLNHSQKPNKGRKQAKPNQLIPPHIDVVLYFRKGIFIVASATARKKFTVI